MVSMLAQGLGLENKECDDLFESDNPMFASEEEAAQVSATRQVGTSFESL
jgi:hypothetical protein